MLATLPTHHLMPRSPSFEKTPRPRKSFPLRSGAVKRTARDGGTAYARQAAEGGPTVEDLTRFGIALLGVPAMVVVGGIVIGLIARRLSHRPH
jgi:hypothetical protein